MDLRNNAGSLAPDILPIQRLKELMSFQIFNGETRFGVANQSENEMQLLRANEHNACDKYLVTTSLAAGLIFASLGKTRVLRQLTILRQVDMGSSA